MFLLAAANTVGGVSAGDYVNTINNNYNGGI